MDVTTTLDRLCDELHAHLHQHEDDRPARTLREIVLSFRKLHRRLPEVDLTACTRSLEHLAKQALSFELKMRP